MSKMIKRLFLLTVTICFCSILNHVSSQQNKLDQTYSNSTSKPPEFKDGLKTIDNLKAAYKCEAIELENWGEDDAIDSTLTVCLINSTNVPTGKGDEVLNQFKSIAGRIKEAVSHPENYKSYYIIFVERKMQFGLMFNSHKSGADIPVQGL